MQRLCGIMREKWNIIGENDDEETFWNMIWDLMIIIASLHNEYYKEVNGKYYDYMFHWVNKMNAGSIEDDIFKS